MANLSVKEVIQRTTEYFRRREIEQPRLEAELLLAHTLNWQRIQLYVNHDFNLSENETVRCREFVRRRSEGEPTAYILGYKDFYKYRFRVGPGVLIPRPETESIVEYVLQRHRGELTDSLRQSVTEKSGHDLSLRLLDLGVGSGCVGLSLIASLPNARLMGVDLSSQAIDLASENAKAMGLSDRVSFRLRDVCELNSTDIVCDLGGPADIVVANPPYIDHSDPEVDKNVRTYEPALALFSEEGGLFHIRSWANHANSLIRVGGLIMFEIGSRQGDAAVQIFEQECRYQDVKLLQDLSGRDRFVVGIKANQ